MKNLTAFPNLIVRSIALFISFATSTFYLLPDFGRWQPYNVAYEHMFAMIFFSWGICLYRAAANPASNMAIIDFTILQGFLHGGIMFIDAFKPTHSHLHFAGDVLFHLLSSVLLLTIYPRLKNALPQKLDLKENCISLLLFLVIGLVVFYCVFIAL